LVKFTKGNTTAVYKYNPQNQRISKKVGNQTTFYLYAGANLIAEYNGAGQRTKRYDYLPGKYVATQIQDQNGTYEVHDDHLDTPRLMTNSSKQVVWKSDHQAFGQTSPKQDPDGNGKGITFNQRFPGQYYDKETGLYYNWNRYYDPSIGRYVTSDPIGLDGGINTYNYVDGSPLIYWDDGGLSKRSGRTNARINRKAKALKARIQSLRDRLNNVRQRGQDKLDRAKQIRDTLDHIRDLLDELERLEDYIPTRCVEWSCPWDKLKQPCPGPQASPRRGPSAGCTCSKELYAY